jgi:hypothetical protein
VRFDVRMTAGRCFAEVREHLEQEGLELVVGPVDLVDEQDDRIVGGDRLQQRAADQVLRPEQLALVDGALLGRAQVQQLARVVPLVHGVRDVEALVALQADQPSAGGRGEGLRELGLAHAGLALEQQRLADGERDEQRRGQAALGQVGVLEQGPLQVVHRGEADRIAHLPKPSRQTPESRRTSFA